MVKGPELVTRAIAVDLEDASTRQCEVGSVFGTTDPDQRVANEVPDNILGRVLTPFGDDAAPEPPR